jgi:hypothetical protein
MEDVKLIKLEVSDTEPPVVKFKLLSRIPEGSFLRLRASGTAMLQCLEITDVRARDSELSLPFVHKFSRQEMQNDWMWHIRTMSMAVLGVTEELPSGSTLEVHASYRNTRRQQYSGLSWDMSLGIVDDSRDLDIQEIAEPIEIRFVSGPAERMEVYLKPDGSLLVEHFDSCGNPTDKYKGKLRIEAENEEIELQSSVSMAQTRGCFETEETDERWRIYNGGLGGSARTALMRGYQLGFIGGTDNHCGWPTRQGVGYCGLTAVQAANL